MSRLGGAIHDGAGAFSRAMGWSWARAFLSGEPLAQPGSAGRADGLDAVWTRISVTSLAQAVRVAPRRLLDAEDRIITDGPLTRLLDRPNPLQDWADFIEELCVQLLTPPGATAIVLEGAAQAPDGSLVGGAVPTAMRIIDAERLWPVWAPGEIDPVLIGWEYITRFELGRGNSGGGRLVRLPVERVIPIRLPDGTTHNPAMGLAPQGSSRDAIAIDRSMGQYARRFFDNGAFAGAVLTTDSTLTESQLKQNADAWDKKHRGSANAWKTAILHRGLKPAQTQTHRDMAFPELAKENRERQLAPYGVPPIVAGIVEDANRSNSETQLMQFVTGAVAGLADRIAGVLNHGLVAPFAWTDSAVGDAPRMTWSRSRHDALNPDRRRLYSECARRRTLGMALRDPTLPAALRASFTGTPVQGLYIAFDFDSNPAVARNKLSQITNLQALHQMGVPLNDLLDLADFSLPRLPSGDVAFVPFNLVPADVAASEKTIPDPGAAPAPTPAKDGAAVPVKDGGVGAGAKPPKRSLEVPAEPPAETSDDALVTRYGPLRAAAIRGIADRHRNSWTPLAGALTKRYAAHIKAQGRGVVARLKSETAKIHSANAASTEGMVARSILPEDAVQRVAFDLEEAQGAVEAIARPYARAAVELGASQGIAEGAGLTGADLGARVSVLVEDPRVKAALRANVAEFRLVESDRRDALLSTIRDAFNPADGGPSKTLAELVTDLETFYEGARGDAKRTAVTETGKALGVARHAGLEDSGIDGHAWLTTSANPRPAHAEAAARYGDNPIPIGEAFDVGGEELMHPGDPAGSAGNIINCYCVELAVPLLQDERAAQSSGAFLGWFGQTTGAERAQANGVPPGRRLVNFRGVDSVIARYATRAFLTIEDLGIDPEAIGEGRVRAA